MIRRPETTDQNHRRGTPRGAPISNPKPNNNSTALLHLILSSIQLTINQQQSTQTKAPRLCISQHWTHHTHTAHTTPPTHSTQQRQSPRSSHEKRRSERSMLDSFFSLPLRLLSALVRGRLWLVLGTVWAVFELRRLEPDSYLRKNSDNFSICKPETGESMTEENNRIIVSVDELADFFCLSRQRVSQLTAEGVLHRRSSGRGYDLKENIQDYIQNLQRRANGRRSLGEEELKKKKLEADIALKESQGELHQLKTAIASGQYISVEEVQMDYSRFFVTFKKFALNLPARIIGFVSGQLDPAESRKLEKDISQEINGMLEAFVIAGTEAKPAEPKKPKRGRPKKAPD